MGQLSDKIASVFDSFNKESGILKCTIRELEDRIKQLEEELQTLKDVREFNALHEKVILEPEKFGELTMNELNEGAIDQVLDNMRKGLDKYIDSFDPGGTKW
jgi:predicted  nucleic acid-binding Zn-ribbon protein